MHALTNSGVKKWVALSEGAGGTVGWLTVCSPLNLCTPLLSRTASAKLTPPLPLPRRRTKGRRCAALETEHALHSQSATLSIVLPFAVHVFPA